MEDEREKAQRKRAKSRRKVRALAFLQPDRVGISTSFIASLPPRHACLVDFYQQLLYSIPLSYWCRCHNCVIGGVVQLSKLLKYYLHTTSHKLVIIVFHLSTADKLISEDTDVLYMDPSNNFHRISIH